MINGHYEWAGRLAEEGFVLLKNQNECLPFQSSVKKIALFGSGARHTMKGGTGSGEVYSEKVSTVEQGLKDEGYEIVSESILSRYDAVIANERNTYEKTIKGIAAENSGKALIYFMKTPFQNPEFPEVTEEDIAACPADAAVYVLTRNCGEGSDRKPEAGDFNLTEREIKTIRLLAEKYPRFLLLLNVCGPIDLGPVQRMPGSTAFLLMGMAGCAGGNAIARVISGKVTPSGKLAATWPKHYADIPFYNEYASLNGDICDSYYKEGLYVGYRYFDTFGKRVGYPFGFGLSYANFQIALLGAEQVGEKIKLSLSIENGSDDFPGKEVVQVYVSKPTDLMDHPSKELVAFQKSDVISPGGKQDMSIEIPISRLRSYNENTSSWILEKGEYLLSVGNSSDHIWGIASIIVPEEVTTEQCCKLACCKTLQDELHATDLLKKEQESANSISLNLDVSKSVIAKPDGTTSYQDLLPNDSSIHDLATLCVGSARYSMDSLNAIGNQSKMIPGAAGETTGELSSKGIAPVSMADGPAGLRISPDVYIKDGEYFEDKSTNPLFRLLFPESDKKMDLTGYTKLDHHTTALPTETLLAQSWNPDILYEAGDLVGREMEKIGVDILLAPALNIQKNPLCGRNYEYYSEDPLLSGIYAASFVNGVQSHPGKGVSIKHFAANNQETNRHYNCSHVSERVLREIYLTGFEYCVKHSNPFTVMSSYNLIGGVHVANSHELLTTVLREEWEFSGLVMTDWGATGHVVSSEGQKYDTSLSAECIHAGNDLIMPGSLHDIEDIENAVNTGRLSLVDIKTCASRVLHLVDCCRKENPRE